MKPITLWNAILSALSGICLLFVLVPVLYLMFGSTPGTLWETLKDPEVLESLGLTFFCGFIALLLGLLVGTPLAYLLARSDFKAKQFIQGIVDVPIVIPHPVAGIALLLVFANWGPGLSPIGSWTGIVIAMFFVSVSLLINAAQAGFQAVPREMEWTSRSLGVGPVKTFFRVALPLNRRNLLAGAIMMWARSISEFGSIVILVYNPKVASVLIYDRFSSFGLSYSLPVAVILIWLSVILFFFMRTLQMRNRPVVGY
ncbi:MAG: ABC transporter permease [Acidobacteria bacterium]|nr:ABC transporter permease [Acidobacteriota bacterium]MCH8016945.1 ABC transporter permease [Acidobacteriota bacterium]